MLHTFQSFLDIAMLGILRSGLFLIKRITSQPPRAFIQKGQKFSWEEKVKGLVCEAHAHDQLRFFWSSKSRIYTVPRQYIIQEKQALTLTDV
jgi:hypothetical protein